MHLDLALDVRRKIPGISFLKFRPLPVVAADGTAATRVSTPTIEFIIGHGVAHGVVETNFLADFDVSHCNESNLARKTCIRIARVIDIISFTNGSRHQKMTIFNLDAQTAITVRKVDKGVPFVNDAPENGCELTLLEWLKGKDSVSTAIGLRAAFQLRRQIGTWLLGHSYNFLSLYGLKMNSASPGGRAGKNAIGVSMIHEIFEV